MHETYSNTNTDTGTHKHSQDFTDTPCMCFRGCRLHAFVAGADVARDLGCMPSWPGQVSVIMAAAMCSLTGGVYCVKAPSKIGCAVLGSRSLCSDIECMVLFTIPCPPPQIQQPLCKHMLIKATTEQLYVKFKPTHQRPVMHVACPGLG